MIAVKQSQLPIVELPVPATLANGQHGESLDLRGFEILAVQFTGNGAWKSGANTMRLALSLDSDPNTAEWFYPVQGSVGQTLDVKQDFGFFYNILAPAQARIELTAYAAGSPRLILSLGNNR